MTRLTTEQLQSLLVDAQDHLINILPHEAISLITELMELRKALEDIRAQHAGMPFEVTFSTDAVLGRLLKCREIADESLNHKAPK